MKTEKNSSQMRKGVLEFCILTILSEEDEYASKKDYLDSKKWFENFLKSEHRIYQFIDENKENIITEYVHDKDPMDISHIPLSGYSRDDISSFLPVYIDKKILKVDPFQVLDQTGVGQLVEMAVKKGRATRPDLKCGICGEHGGEPSSVKFCHRVGLNYVSCSPFRVPIARLAAAQAAIEDDK